MQTSSTAEPLTDKQISELKYGFKGLYSYLKDHPALMEPRLYVGLHKPDATFKPEVRYSMPKMNMNMSSRYVYQAV